MKRKLVVADICNTLFDSNTTYDFIKYCIDTGKLPAYKKVIYIILLSRLSPFFWFILAGQKVLQQDVFKTLVVSLLRGRTVQEVNGWADQFYDDFLKIRLIHSSFSILKEFDKKDMVLVSSTLQPIAASIAKNLNISHYLASNLEMKGNKYTGKILNELSGRKLASLKERFKEEWDLELVITDNFTDIELMNHSRKRYAVCYNKRQERFWSVVPRIIIVNIPPAQERTR